MQSGTNHSDSEVEDRVALGRSPRAWSAGGDRPRDGVRARDGTRARASGRLRRRAPAIEVRRLDEALARAAGETSAMRLQMGAVLEVMALRGLHHEMGFSSLEAYALERCERSARWVQEARRVARALEAVPDVRAALVSGALGWSVACLVAGRASRADELAWLEAARTLTVRQLRALVATRSPSRHVICDGIEATCCDDERFTEPPLVDARQASHGGCRTGGGASSSGAGATPFESASGEEPRMRELKVTVDREDAWLFECARAIVARVSGGKSADEIFEALLAEGAVALADLGAVEPFGCVASEEHEQRQQAWERRLQAWRDEAEARCEPRLVAAPAPLHREVPLVAELSRRPMWQLDGLLRATARDLARRDLAVGRLAEELWMVDGWRRLGYASEQQYARERLGMSLSAIRSKRAVARRAGALPGIAEALSNGSIGGEAARLVAGVADAVTCDAWLERAKRRTVVQLREEIAAATLRARLTASDHVEPPTDETLRAVQTTESAVVSGAWLTERDASSVSDGEGDDAAGPSDARSPRRQMSASEVGAPPPSDEHRGELHAAFKERLRAALNAEAPADLAPRSTEPSGAARGRVETSGIARGRGETSRVARGRVVLRFWVSASTHRAYRGVEQAFRRAASGDLPLLRFLCLAFIDAWKHALPPRMAYGHIYARDRFRCASPVCTRRDVTPHHVRYRSHGGDDSEDNVISLCVWCHLEGIHGGRLRASGPAHAVRWAIGRSPHTVVSAREREQIC